MHYLGTGTQRNKLRLNSSEYILRCAHSNSHLKTSRRITGNIHYHAASCFPRGFSDNTYNCMPSGTQLHLRNFGPLNWFAATHSLKLDCSHVSRGNNCITMRKYLASAIPAGSPTAPQARPSQPNIPLPHAGNP